MTTENSITPEPHPSISAQETTGQKKPAPATGNERLISLLEAGRYAEVAYEFNAQDMVSKLQGVPGGEKLYQAFRKYMDSLQSENFSENKIAENIEKLEAMDDKINESFSKAGDSNAPDITFKEENDAFDKLVFTTEKIEKGYSSKDPNSLARITLPKKLGKLKDTKQDIKEVVFNLAREQAKLGLAQKDPAKGEVTEQEYKDAIKYNMSKLVKELETQGENVERTEKGKKKTIKAINLAKVCTYLAAERVVLEERAKSFSDSRIVNIVKKGIKGIDESGKKAFGKTYWGYATTGAKFLLNAGVGMGCAMAAGTGSAIGVGVYAGYIGCNMVAGTRKRWLQSAPKGERGSWVEFAWKNKAEFGKVAASAIGASASLLTAFPAGRELIESVMSPEVTKLGATGLRRVVTGTTMLITQTINICEKKKNKEEQKNAYKGAALSVIGFAAGCFLGGGNGKGSENEIRNAFEDNETQTSPVESQGNNNTAATSASTVSKFKIPGLSALPGFDDEGKFVGFSSAANSGPIVVPLADDNVVGISSTTGTGDNNVVGITPTVETGDNSQTGGSQEQTETEGARAPLQVQFAEFDPEKIDPEGRPFYNDPEQIAKWRHSVYQLLGGNKGIDATAELNKLLEQDNLNALAKELDMPKERLAHLALLEKLMGRDQLLRAVTDCGAGLENSTKLVENVGDRFDRFGEWKGNRDICILGHVDTTNTDCDGTVKVKDICPPPPPPAVVVDITPIPDEVIPEVKIDIEGDGKIDPVDPVEDKPEDKPKEEPEVTECPKHFIIDDPDRRYINALEKAQLAQMFFTGNIDEEHGLIRFVDENGKEYYAGILPGNDGEESQITRTYRVADPSERDYVNGNTGDPRKFHFGEVEGSCGGQEAQSSDQQTSGQAPEQDKNSGGKKGIIRKLFGGSSSNDSSQDSNYSSNLNTLDNYPSGEYNIDGSFAASLTPDQTHLSGERYQGNQQFIHTVTGSRVA